MKWLRRIELSDRPLMTREETSKYTDPMADGTAGLFRFLMDARSLITYPAYPLTRGWGEINGIAWPGSGKITRRREHRRRRDVDAGPNAGAGAFEGAHAVPACVELDRR